MYTAEELEMENPEERNVTVVSEVETGVERPRLAEGSSQIGIHTVARLASAVGAASWADESRGLDDGCRHGNNIPSFEVCVFSKALKPQKQGCYDRMLTVAR